MTLPKRPLRSVFLGDLHYRSYYRAGVSQGMNLLGAWHQDMSLHDSPATIDKQMREMRPDLVWTHMLMWPPRDCPHSTYDLLQLARQWRQRGAKVLIHDGDPREKTRFPHDVSLSVDLALLNHQRPVPEWLVPTLYWPYAAMTQAQIADPVDEYRCSLLFTGRLRDGELYGARSECVKKLLEIGGLSMKHFPGPDGINNRMQTADMAASATAVLGFGRPEREGWIDTRVFQYPGAGGVLIHDDVGGMLTPDVHYVPCKHYDVDSILKALETAKRGGDAIRQAAFEHVQKNHTFVQRCQQVIDHFYG